MNGKRARVPLRALKKRPLRLDPGTEDELKFLASSWLENPLHDILARESDMVVADGSRRVLGLELLGETEADVLLIEGDLTDTDLDRIAWVSAYHRAPLGGYEQACVLRSIKEGPPPLTNKEAAAGLKIDVTMPTKLLSIFDCVPAVQEAAKQGRVGVKGWYAISQLPAEDQPAMLAVRLGGASSDEIDRQSRRQRSSKPAESPSTSSKRLKCPLPTGQTVTVAGTSPVTLDGAIETLKDALKAMVKARDQGLDTSVAQRVWANMAAAAD